ncbi:nicotinate-nucleotide adenylyltransferase [Legionella jordanis]|nr:nicotinate-nucleotide adenylyltransferase [Legionella jordanis]VEH12415.1 nicotinate-nucleotide adenylyltransferase NadD [Legionella jordanis]
MHSIIIYGGTFDPVHQGHVKTACNIQAHFHFDQFIFLPCKIPVLKRKAVATSQQRIDMLRLALKNTPSEFSIDLSEIERSGPSYMVVTLEDFRNRFGSDAAITLLLGMDAFLDLPRWHEWQKILTLANLLVINRPESGNSLPILLENLLKKHETKDESMLLTNSHGYIVRYDAGNFNISSTFIRQQFARGETQDSYLSADVLNYILKNQLYHNNSG